jgi:hypothetical protein
MGVGLQNEILDFWLLKFRPNYWRFVGLVVSLLDAIQLSGILLVFLGLGVSDGVLGDILAEVPAGLGRSIYLEGRSFGDGGVFVGLLDHLDLVDALLLLLG